MAARCLCTMCVHDVGIVSKSHPQPAKQHCRAKCSLQQAQENPQSLVILDVEEEHNHPTFYPCQKMSKLVGKQVQADHTMPFSPLPFSPSLLHIFTIILNQAMATPSSEVPSSVAKPVIIKIVFVISSAGAREELLSSVEIRAGSIPIGNGALI